MACFNVTTNAGGIPYLVNTNVAVSATAVDLALGWQRRLAPVGYFTLRIAESIPAGTTGTLPVTLSLNGVTRSLTFANGESVTAADLENVSVIMVFNDRFNNLLVLITTA